MNEKVLMSAHEARRIIEEGESEKAKMIWNEVAGGIERAVAAGETHYTKDGSLPEPVLKKLRNLGYKAKNDSQHNQEYYYISWGGG